jgi:hypothetical protein
MYDFNSIPGAGIACQHIPPPGIEKLKGEK